MTSVLFIVVLYKTHPRDCATLRSLSKLEFGALLPTFAIWDNSPDGYGEDALPTLPGTVFYERSGQNEGLARVYNTMVNRHRTSDWIVILDDDSSIEREYLQALATFFASGGLVAVPRIFHEGQLISPGRISGVRGVAMAAGECRPGVVASKHMVAMMSGTIIGRRVFEDGLAFDERLKLYGVDTRFFIDFSERYESLFVLDYSMPHRSALREPGGGAAYRERCRNLMVSRPVVFEAVKFRRLRLSFYLAAYVTKLAITRRDVRFLRLYGAIRCVFAGGLR